MNNQLYGDPLEVLDQACYEYRVSMFGMVNPDESKIATFRSAEVKYKKAIKEAIKYLRSELRLIEESNWNRVSNHDVLEMGGNDE